ncbi:hypothetical protein M569_17333 [Genlisea aurea]|uniref:Uncharacterized protein n=1 Tax=Genlisea aurea TaxID=192259 RepID=S8BSW4_9LAMI|nr:hypothetical protein M569_17333 [Genlisea aurea]
MFVGQIAVKILSWRLCNNVRWIETLFVARDPPTRFHQGTSSSEISHKKHEHALERRQGDFPVVSFPLALEASPFCQPSLVFSPGFRVSGNFLQHWSSKVAVAVRTIARSAGHRPVVLQRIFLLSLVFQSKEALKWWRSSTFWRRARFSPLVSVSRLLKRRRSVLGLGLWGVEKSRGRKTMMALLVTIVIWSIGG